MAKKTITVAAQPDTTLAIIVDANRQTPIAAEIPTVDFGIVIRVGGRDYEHVTEDAEGTWVFAPAGK
jgi:hypothetical protein